MQGSLVWEVSMLCYNRAPVIHQAPCYQNTVFMPLVRAQILRKHALNAMHNGSGFYAGARARSCAWHAPHKSAWAFKMTLQHVTSELSSHILEIPMMLIWHFLQSWSTCTAHWLKFDGSKMPNTIDRKTKVEFLKMHHGRINFRLRRFWSETFGLIFPLIFVGLD